MQKALYIFILLTIVCFSCNKSRPEEENVVVYTVVETSNNNPVFSVIYSTPQGDKTAGPFDQKSWLSKQLPNFKREDFVSLKIETNSSIGSFTSAVYLNGVLVKEEKMDLPYLKKLEATLPPSY